MQRDNFPIKVTRLMDSIEANVVTDPEVFQESCSELERYARQTHNESLIGYCLFFRGYACYVAAELEESLAFLSEALNPLITGENWQLAARTFNAMGNIADFQGDSSLAIDCYIKGLIMSREHEIAKAEYDICSNIANVYIGLGEFGAAVELLELCENMKHKIENLVPESEIIVCANLCQTYLHIGNTDAAFEQLNRLKELCQKHVYSINDISINILETELYNAVGNIEARDAAIERLASVKFGSLNVFDALNELYTHCMLLLEIGKYDEFLKMVERIEFLANGPTVDQQILELRMNYFDKVGDRESYLELAGKYYILVSQRKKEQNKIISHNIATRMRLVEEENRRKEVEISNLQLKQKSEHDPLTGMNNRYKLNELAELAFHRAYLNGTPLTIEILDIDCYKEFNDNYGHQAGDDCLIRIAEAIRSMEDFSGVHTARYGGDEFVVIYEEYSKRDVERMAQRLQDKIKSLNIEHKFSKVSDRITISQGLFHKIPSGGNKTWDFLYAADMALYAVKNSGKNHFYVGTDFEGVRNHYKEARNASGKK